MLASRQFHCITYVAAFLQVDLFDPEIGQIPICKYQN